MIITITTTTTNIPTHTPALKIPPMTSHEFRENKNKRLSRNRQILFFILFYLPMYMQKYCHRKAYSLHSYNLSAM